MRTVAGLCTLFAKINATHLLILFIFLRENAANFTKRLDVTIYWDVIVVVRSSSSAMALTKAKRTEYYKEARPSGLLGSAALTLNLL